MFYGRFGILLTITMAYVQRKFKQTQISSLYKQAYGEKFLWPTLLAEPLRSYMSLMSVAKNMPVTVAMGSIIPLTACVCGPKTEIKIEEQYKMKLNTYSMIVAAPGGGKSTAYQLLLQSSFDVIKERTDKLINLESYSMAGLQRHQNENEGMLKIYLHWVITENHTFKKIILNKYDKLYVCQGKGSNPCIRMQTERCSLVMNLSRDHTDGRKIKKPKKISSVLADWLEIGHMIIAVLGGRHIENSSLTMINPWWVDNAHVICCGS